MFLGFTPVFADNVVCNASLSGNMTIITCPNISQTQHVTAPYYVSPQPSNGLTSNLVNTFFNKLNQATVEFSGTNANQVQNLTGGVQQVVITGISYVYAIKYLVASLLGLIVPKLFGVSVPSWILPAIEYGTIILIGLAIWKHAWKIFIVSLIIGIFVILLFFVGGVLFH